MDAVDLYQMQGNVLRDVWGEGRNPGANPKSETRMTNETRIPNDECLNWDFGQFKTPKPEIRMKSE